MSTNAIATIDLNAIVHNYRALQIRCGTADVAATLKANAYGLGAGQIAHALYRAGCRYFYVAHYHEALALRALHSDTHIAIYHGIPTGYEDDAAKNNITAVINDLGALQRVRDAAHTSGTQPSIILHRDTAMNRTGFGETEWNTLVNTPDLLAGLHLNIVMSHFACSDEPTHPMNEQQRCEFIVAAKHFPSAKKSLANSHGIFLGSAMHFDHVRPGRALYGIGGFADLIPALSIHAPIVQLRSIDSDGTVGYGATERVNKGMRLATLAYGYADGLHRAFSNTDLTKGHHVYVHGIAAPIMGRVSMDLTVVDVSNVPEHLLHVGGMAEIVGAHQTIDDFAAQIGTIDYELMTQMGNRVERRYIEVAA